MIDPARDTVIASDLRVGDLIRIPTLGVLRVLDVTRNRAGHDRQNDAPDDNLRVRTVYGTLIFSGRTPLTRMTPDTPDVDSPPDRFLRLASDS